MAIQVGTHVTYIAPDQQRFPATVLELQGEHARCSFPDGRIAWVPLASLSPEYAAPWSPPVGVMGPAPAFSPMAAPVPVPANPDDKPLEWPLFALIYLGLAVVPLGCTLLGAVAFSVPYWVWRKDKPKRASQWNRHVWIAFAIGVVWMGTAAVIAGVLEQQREKKDAAALAAGVVPGNWKSWTGGTCEFKTPTAWKLNAAAKNPHASIEVIDEREDMLVLLIEEPLEDFDANFTLERYADASLSDTLRALPIGLSMQVKFGPYDAQREVRAGSVDGVKLTFLRYTFRSSSHFHQALGIAQTRTFPTQEALLSRILESTRCGGPPSTRL